MQLDIAADELKSVLNRLRRAQGQLAAIIRMIEEGRDYARIAVPCLSIGFADDRMIPAYLSREVADVIPGARYVEIADAGHYGYLEKPEEFNR
ncbi:alpha/beta fold hydrolase, partial [Streptomyces sp. NPDC057545]|uniref:alpha/beta fold hydrolase n=1 Tax=Streptomyces sp. NPDC057545 TaxID=3346164 RepID=UPI0036C66307